MYSNYAFTSHNRLIKSFQFAHNEEHVIFVHCTQLHSLKVIVLTILTKIIKTGLLIIITKLKGKHL